MVVGGVMDKKKRELERRFFDRLSEDIQKVELPEALDSYTKSAYRILGDLQGKRILDMGCGDGTNTYTMAAKASYVFGIDISLGMLKRAKTFKEDRKNVSFLEMDLEIMGFKDGVFDLIFGSYILHHVDIIYSLREVCRVLKKGGIGVFIENFAFNPIIIFFRRYFTGRFGIPRYGTVSEHPLTHRDLMVAKSLFYRIEIRNPDLNFMKLLDRQIFKYRYPTISNVCNIFDSWIYHSFKGLRKFSYTQILLLQK